MTEITRKVTKATQVFEQLRTDIVTGKLAPAEKLQMDALSERYGVGYSPLREALCRLASNGLVRAEEQCGFYVSPLSLDEVRDLYNIRIYIENLALALAMENGDDQWEADIMASWHSYAKYLNPNNTAEIDPDQWGALQKAFRFSLIKACQSPWLLKIRDMLQDQAARYRNLCLSTNYKNKALMQHFLHENEMLVNAVLTRDKEKALAISEISWRDSLNTIIDILSAKS